MIAPYSVTLTAMPLLFFRVKSLTDAPSGVWPKIFSSKDILPLPVVSVADRPNAEIKKDSASAVGDNQCLDSIVVFI